MGCNGLDRRTYVSLKLEDFHLPNICIVESGKPTWLAVVAAPIRKLWPLKHVMFKPDDESAVRTALTSVSLDKGMPERSRKRGPGVGGRMAMKARSADTEQIQLSVFPRWMVTPAPKTSVLLRQSNKLTTDGFV